MCLYYNEERARINNDSFLNNEEKRKLVNEACCSIQYYPFVCFFTCTTAYTAFALFRLVLKLSRFFLYIMQNKLGNLMIYFAA